MLKRRSLHESAHKAQPKALEPADFALGGKRTLNEAAHKLGHLPARRVPTRTELELAASPEFEANENRDVVAAGGRLVLALAALGVVYGDIGTSPLYTEQV